MFPCRSYTSLPYDLALSLQYITIHKSRVRTRPHHLPLHSIWLTGCERTPSCPALWWRAEAIFNPPPRSLFYYYFHILLVEVSSMIRDPSRAVVSVHDCLGLGPSGHAAANKLSANHRPKYDQSTTCRVAVLLRFNLCTCQPPVGRSETNYTSTPQTREAASAYKCVSIWAQTSHQPPDQFFFPFPRSPLCTVHFLA